jgi:hypothetical protein
MSVDREYRIRIQTEGDPSGAQTVAGALDKTTSATEGAAKATEKHTVGLHAMHKVFGALNDVVPGLGVLMQAAFSPVGAAISIAVMALRLFQEHMREVNKEMDRMESESAKPLTNRLEIMRESVIRNAAGLAEYKERLADASHSQLTLADAIARVVAAMKEENNTLGSLAEIGERAELATLENMHKAGLVSEEQYAQMRLRIEQDLAAKKRKLAEDELQAEINIRKEAVKAAANNQGNMDAAAAQGRTKSEAATTENEVAKDDLEKAKDLAKAAAEAVAAFKKDHASFSVSKAMRAAMFGGSGAEEAKKDLAEYQRLQAEAARAAQYRDAQVHKVAGAGVSASEAANEYKRALDAAAANRTITTKSQEEVAQKEAELAARKKADDEIAKAAAEAAKVSSPLGQAATEDVARAMATAKGERDSRKTGVHPSLEAEQQMVDVATRIAGQKVSLAQAVAIMERAAGDQAAFTDDVMKLVTVMGNMARFFQKFPNFQGQLDSIAAQVRALESHPTTRTLPGN